MNKSMIIFHLKEARKELDRTIAELETSPDYDAPEFQVAMSHLYTHLNTAWNARNASPERQRECAQSDFDTWRKCPINADFFLE